MPSERRAPTQAAAAAIGFLLVLACGTAEPGTVLVPLWANDESAARLPGVSRMVPHPCGSTVLVRLSRIPPHRGSEGALGTDLVVERSPPGFRWSVPVDFAPVAVEDAALLLESAQYGRLWIETDGRIRRAPPGRPYPPGVERNCPEPPIHGESDYAGCVEFVDLRTGRPRLLEFEAVCS